MKIVKYALLSIIFLNSPAGNKKLLDIQPVSHVINKTKIIFFIKCNLNSHNLLLKYYHNYMGLWKIFESGDFFKISHSTNFKISQKNFGSTTSFLLSFSKNWQKSTFALIPRKVFGIDGKELKIKKSIFEKKNIPVFSEQLF